MLSVLHVYDVNILIPKIVLFCLKLCGVLDETVNYVNFDNYNVIV